MPHSKGGKAYTNLRQPMVRVVYFLIIRGGILVSVSTMTYCVVQINCLPLPRFFKEVTMKTAKERYEETWNSYLELLNKDPRASLVSFDRYYQLV